MGMGMRISSNSTASQTGAAAWQQRQQNLQDLTKALQVNDLTAAQTAYAAMTKNAPASAMNNPNSPLAQLGSALQSGDVNAAQKALAAMQTRHHHHRADNDSDDASATTPPRTPSAPTATMGNNVNLVA